MSRRETYDLEDIIQWAKLPLDIRPGSVAVWVMQNGSTGVRAEVSWDEDSGSLTGDLVEWGPGESAVLISFDAEVSGDELDTASVTGRNVLGEWEEDDPKGCLLAFGAAIAAADLKRVN